MSAYSDWKCGALTDEEYKYYNRRECGGDGPIDPEYDSDYDGTPGQYDNMTGSMNLS